MSVSRRSRTLPALSSRSVVVQGMTSPVEADGGHDRRVVAEDLEEVLDTAAVRVDGPRHPPLVAVGDQLAEVAAQQRLAAGDDERRPLQRDQLVDDEPLRLGGAEFLAPL